MRYVVVTNYDDFPHSLEISLEVRDQAAYPYVFEQDLWHVLAPLGVPLSEASRQGAYEWKPMRRV